MSQAKVLDPGSFSHSPSLSSKDKYEQKKASPWSVFCPAWPSPLRTSLNRSFAAPQESKSMGNVLALSAKGNRRVVQQHEKWHYNEEAEASFWKPIGARLLRAPIQTWDKWWDVNSATHLLAIRQSLSEILDFLWSLLLFPLSQNYFANLIA